MTQNNFGRRGSAMTPISELIDMTKKRAGGKFFIMPKRKLAYPAEINPAYTRRPEQVLEHEVAAFCASLGRPAPSEMDPERRSKLRSWLSSPRGTAMFQAWRAEQ